ncbi:hypothetical protein ACH5RR_032112 [Cinchona calisaya]|uniref:Uncharacterized protein n=1 Tax=Cinchona calisaya TaxID=153742 RepID=A0ABD2YKL2_9GENT
MGISHLDMKMICGLPIAARYSGVLAKKITISQARLVFRSEQHVEYYSNLLEHSKDMEFLDTDELFPDNFEFLLSIHAASLPIKVNSDIWIEPYYPNRFARQFGFDQGVPDNDLKFSVSQRNNYHIAHLAVAQRRHFRSNTHARFFIPSRDRIRDRTWCGKQIKIKVRRLSSSRSDEKNFKQTHRYKGLSPESSPETKYTTSFTDPTDQTASPSVVNELASKVISPIPINQEFFVDLVMDPNGTQLNRVSQPKGILSDTQAKEVSLVNISKKMVTNLGTEVENFSRDFIIGSFQAIVKLITSSNLSEFLKSQQAVSRHLMRLNGVVLDGDAGQTAVDWFVKQVLQTFDLVEKDYFSGRVYERRRS